MRIAASVFGVFLVLATTAGAQSPAVRVFITDNLASITDNLAVGAGEGGWGVADGWGVAEWAFREFAGRGECRGLMVTSQPWRAHFTISRLGNGEMTSSSWISISAAATLSPCSTAGATCSMRDLPDSSGMP